MEFDPRLPSNGLVVLVGSSGAGKTSALLQLIAGRSHSFQKPVSRCLVLAAHPDQQAYSQLTKHIPSVSFYQINPQKGITLVDLKREFNLGSEHQNVGTRLLIIDDVTRFSYIIPKNVFLN